MYQQQHWWGTENNMVGLHKYFRTKFAMMLVRRVVRSIIGPKLKPIKMQKNAPKPVMPGFIENE